MNCVDIYWMTRSGRTGYTECLAIAVQDEIGYCHRFLVAVPVGDSTLSDCVLANQNFEINSENSSFEVRMECLLGQNGSSLLARQSSAAVTCNCQSAISPLPDPASPIIAHQHIHSISGLLIPSFSEQKFNINLCLWWCQWPLDCCSIQRLPTVACSLLQFVIGFRLTSITQLYQMHCLSLNLHKFTCKYACKKFSLTFGFFSTSISFYFPSQSDYCY